MQITIRNILIFIGFVIFFFGLWFFRSIVVYILISGVLSLVGRPIVDFLNRLKYRRWVMPRAVSAVMTLVLLWGLIFVFAIVFFPLVNSQVTRLSGVETEQIVSLMDDQIERLELLVSSVSGPNTEEFSVKKFINEKVSNILNPDFIQNFLQSFLAALGNIAVAIFAITFITFFFLKDERLFYESIMMWIPVKYEEGARRALSSIKRLLMRYFIGIIIQSLCVATLITIGMTIVGLGFQQAITIGLIIGLLNVIPYVGPWIGGAIGILIGVATNLDMGFSDYLAPLMFYMILVIMITQVVDNIVFQPFIFANSVSAHPLEIFIVILAAGSFAGVAGMILAIPTYTVIRVIGKEFFNSFKAVAKITSSLRYVWLIIIS
jgi:predicted PurR-regulated permease PerM